VVVQRPALYVERRTDGYREPEVILILGTAHLSEKSARDAKRLVAAVRPQNVVVELCRSRSGIMWEEEEEEGGRRSKGQWQAG
jgi:pheromone shutdown protein TraB